MLFFIIRFKFILIFLVIITAVFVLYIYQNQTKISQKEKLSAYIAKLLDLKQSLTLSGKIQADEKASLKFQTSGRLSWVGVKEGDIVKKWQALASLDQRDVKKALEKKLNAYLSERWDFEQNQDDYEIHGTPINKITLTDSEKRILEKSQFDLNNSVLDVEIADLSREYATLITPIAGIVTHIDTPYPGVNITPASAEFLVINPNSIYFSVSADQSEVVNLKKDMPAKIVLDSFSDNTIESTISAISFTPKTDESGTVYEVKLVLPINNLDYKYRIEMTGDATFVTSEKSKVLAVPTDYIHEENDKKFVNILKNGQKEKLYVKIGTEIDDHTEILSGLREDETVYD
jgi:membrane fusion protein, multidrug efflux system